MTLQYNNKLTSQKEKVSTNRWASRRLLSLLALAALMLAWTTPAMAQTPDYSGTYFIGTVGYNANNPSNNYYLCPTEGWIYYMPTNDWSTDGTTYPNPFITTYKCKGTQGYAVAKAVWTIEKAPAPNADYYYIKQTLTGKYIVSNGQINGTTNANRIRVHLETVAPEDLNDLALFSIYEYNGNGYLVIKPKSPTGQNGKNYKWLTVNDGNKNFLVGNGKDGGPTGYTETGGVLGLYTESDANAKFYLEPAVMEPPTITNNFDGTITITAETGATIYYTTDETTPTTESTNSGTTSVTFPLTNGTEVIKAIAKSDLPFTSNVNTYQIPVCDEPIITINGAAVSINCPIEGSSIYYTIDNSPATTLSTPYTVEFNLGCVSTVRAIATSPGYLPSSEATYNVPALVSPIIETHCDNKLYIFCSNLLEGGEIRYTVTTDGSDPEDPTIESLLYEGALTTLADGSKVKAKAFYCSQSSPVSEVFAYSITYTEAPTIGMTSTIVTITGPAGSTIHYTIDGDDPVIGAGGVLSAPSPVEIPNAGISMYIRAIAKVNDLEPSCVTRIITVGTPNVTITAENCSETNPRANVLTLSTLDNSNTIWYAVTAGDNSVAPDPDAVPNPYIQYTDAVSLDDLDGSNTHYTVHAYALSSDGQFRSSIASVSHQMKTAGKPELVPPVGSNPVVAISGGVFGDVAVCTIDMGTPEDASDDVTTYSEIASDGTAEYTISSTATGTLTVSFKHGSWLPSCEATYTLAAAPAAPTWSQDCANKLSLSCATPMADIHYTTNGNEPTLESSTYTPGCLDDLPAGTTIRAKAFTGYRASDELVYIYAATHSLAPQIFVEGNQVVLSVLDHPGATIYFNSTTNGNNTMPGEPAQATTESTLYSADPGINISGITIFSTVAVYDGLEASCPVRYVTRPGYSINSADDLPKIGAHPTDYFFVLNDINASGYTTTVANFTGVIEGNGHTISGLTKPLFETATGAVIHDLALKDISVSADGHVGAIAQTANGATRIYNCGILGSSSTVTTTSSSGTTYVGGLVGLLDGSARVINCYSYATINGGSHRAGIVGYNNVASTSGNLQTMVMNCMFYGNIAYEDGCTVYPVYGGKNIHNLRANDNNTGLNNYCYFYYHGDYVNHIDNDNYHGSLGAEERFLNRFEFFRQTLNSTRNMAAFYVSGNATEKELIAKWVLDLDIAPYPILKAPGYYPSRINLDADHAVPIDPDNVHYNKGRKLGTLTVNIEMGDGAQFTHPVTDDDEAQITIPQLTLNITDKDPDNFNYNYKKVQLPYYNQVGTMNYTNYRVVTGWKIVAVNGSTTGTGSFTRDTWYYPDWNFVDRACSNKDLYSVSGRVFSQGAYWEVPDGVTSITIQPYWAKAAYLSDACYDVTYSGANKYPVTVAGSCPATFNGQTVRNAISGDNSAINELQIAVNATVYDYAVVLMGNYHQYADPSLYNESANKPVTFMSADLDGDCEPDNTLFYYHKARQRVAPIRFDFLNMPGIGMVKRTWNANVNPEIGIFKPVGWFEITNTVTVRFGQFEYVDKGNNTDKLYLSPLILQGGIYEQFVSARNDDPPKDKVSYIHVGGNAWFKNFANGCHTGQEKVKRTPKRPINVTGGDFENFYLTGIYRPEVPEDPENAVCYIDGGNFSEVAGAGMQQIKGDVRWAVNAADIERFFGGGINGDKPITGHITTTISNSRVTEFYGGPKFGDVAAGKIVTTTATNCRFGLFFGAGYGGTAYNRYGTRDVSANVDNPPYNSTYCADYDRKYDSERGGIATKYEYEFILHSDGNQTVARFFVNYAKLSLASTRDVVSTLTGCTIGTFYGGGRLGAVNGDVSSTLTDCTVDGDVFGSGYSAETPKLLVMNTGGFVNPPKYNRRAGVFNDAEVEFPSSVEYTWKHADAVSTGNEFDENGGYYILTTENLDNLGAVLGNATLTINGNSKVLGDVYGGGAKSSANTNGGDAAITVNINGGTYGTSGGTTGGNIYGGGMGDANNAVTEGTVNLNIGNSTQDANNVVIYGSVYGCNNVNGTPNSNVTVNIYKTKHDSSNDVTNLTGGYAISNVFGGGNQASYKPTSAGNKATVHVHNCDNTIQYVYGGGNAADVGTTTINSATDVIIDGGRIEWTFGGGNGAGLGNPGANVYGDVGVTYHAGDIKYLFGGSNEKGTVSGTKTLSLLNDGSCSIPNHIAELYGGNNKAPIVGNVGSTLVMPCAANPCPIDYLFGGSRMADISGDVTLTIEGGNYNKVFGGNNLSGTISGNVTLNLHGGTIGSAFGGNKGGYIDETFYDGGTITGTITVNVEDIGDCPLDVENIFGAGDLAVYTAPSADNNYPVINIKHLRDGHPITGSVFGGGNGDPDNVSQEPGMVTGNPKVIIGDLTVGHDSYTAAISGNVYGGGNAAKVVGNTSVLLQKANSTVGGDIFGGGNLAHVSGSTAVNVTRGTVTGDVYGGGALANTGATTVTLDGGTIGSDLYGGGLGRLADPGNSIEAVAAAVNGNVQVTVNGGTVNGSVFGCNNANGAPTGTVTVDIYGTDHPGSGYALGHVFGGGNRAAYGGTPAVTVHNCDNSIEYVYGGGNKASVASTNVVIYGGNTIGNVFAGGNGEGVADDYVMVSGNAVAYIYGGTIGKVFGGNNSSGTITGTSTVTVNKQTEAEHSSCAMKIGEVYGGGNLADGKAGAINIGCTGDLVALGNGEHYGVDQEGIQYVYGGANQADISNDITLNIVSGIVENVFGGNNTSGAISGSIEVNINKNSESCDWFVGDVYGGGNHADYSGTPAVNIQNGTVSGNVFGGGNDITTVNVGVEGSNVAMTGGTVLGGIYGGCNLNGSVTGNSVVNIYSGTIGSSANLSVGKLANIFGGGLGADTKVGGNVTVNITRATGDNPPAPPDIYGDVYGGSALGSVNTSSSNTTTVNILDGTLHSETSTSGGFTVYTGGNVYGGGLGRKESAGLSAIDAKEYGAVIVNIGSGTPGTSGEEFDGRNFTGNATIQGNIYGCNNTNGSPQYTVTVNVYKTAQTSGTNTVDDNDYAIANVFGGGNEADYNSGAGRKGYVHIYGCKNTIGRVFGGGNAAATPAVETDIQGGRMRQVFGGGNGEKGESYAANVNGIVDLKIHGGNIGEYFGGSNQHGAISGTINNLLDNNGPCGGVTIKELFCGGRKQDHAGDLSTTIDCNQQSLESESLTNVESLYGGCDQANVGGNVVLNLKGGNYKYVYGGSKGDLASLGQGHVDKQANIGGNITLNLYGGTIENVFGGSNINGNISGNIVVNVLDVESDNCPLEITNIYGGSNMTAYTPSSATAITPVVNVVHAKLGIKGNVYGGSKGVVGTSATLTANPLINIGYETDMVGLPPVGEYNPAAYSRKTTIQGTVFGGGDAAKVHGNTEIRMNKGAKVFGNVYGGGNMGEVEGNTKVIVNGKKQ